MEMSDRELQLDIDVASSILAEKSSQEALAEPDPLVIGRVVDDFRRRSPDPGTKSGRDWIVSKTEFTAQFDHWLSVRGVTFDDASAGLRVAKRPTNLSGLLILGSSGSTGIPAVHALALRERQVFLSGSLRRLAFVDAYTPSKASPFRIAWLYSDSAVHVTNWVGMCLAHEPGVSLSQFRSHSGVALATAIAEFKPDLIAGYSSRVGRLAKDAMAEKISINPMAVVTSGEMLTAGARATIEGAFSADPFDLFGMTEGVFGAQCKFRDGFHLFTDLAWLESSSSASDYPVAVTCLFRSLQPVVRLGGSDILSFGGGCGCGSNYPLVRAVVGRTSEMLFLRSGNQLREVSPVSLLSVMDSMIDLEKFRIRAETGELRVQITVRAQADFSKTAKDLTSRVRRDLENRGVEAPIVRVEPLRESAKVREGKQMMRVPTNSDSVV